MDLKASHCEGSEGRQGAFYQIGRPVYFVFTGKPMGLMKKLGKLESV